MNTAIRTRVGTITQALFDISELRLRPDVVGAVDKLIAESEPLKGLTAGLEFICAVGCTLLVGGGQLLISPTLTEATAMTRLALLLLPILGLIDSDSAKGGPPLGFRTDGTGRYPAAAAPPLEWAKDKNVVWHIELKQSNAIPVILGDRLFTCAEPCVLLCVNKQDGKIIWQHESSWKEIIPTEKEKEQIEEERKQDDELKKEQSNLEKEISALRKAIREDPSTKAKNEAKIEPLEAQLNKTRERRKAFATLNRYREPGKDAGGYHPTGGYSSATPVTDGKHVYVIFGNGLAACYDLEGKRQWLKLIEHPTAAYGHGASPVLVGDKLLVHFSDLVALNTKDGREEWRVKIPPSHGTAMHTRLGGVDVVVHPQGQVIRVSDGTVLAKNLGSTGPNSPLVQDGKVFLVNGQVRGYALPTSEKFPEKWEPLWKPRSIKGQGYWFPSPVLHDGLLYAMSSKPILSVIDAKTGELVYEQDLELGAGDCYPSISLAGDRNVLDRDFGPEGPNQSWCADITYIPTGEGWLYLAVVEDLFSRMIVGWSMAESMESRLVVDALEMAIQRRRPGAGLLAHSDRGSRYARALPAGAEWGRDHLQHERGRPVLGQRAGGVLLRASEVRDRTGWDVRDP